VKPPIRWAGSKLKSLALLRTFYNAVPGRYVEAFAGSACLFFDLSPARALIADLNPDLIRAYRALRDDRNRVFERLQSTPRSAEAYYELRAKDPDAMPETDAAARFLYLNRYCFNGLYRTNRSGRFNVPYGHLRKNEQIDYNLLARASDSLQRVELLNADFERCLENARNSDFVYLDPPYATAGGTKLFAEYLPNSFSMLDMERLEESLVAMDRRGVNFVLSYADIPAVRSRMTRWRILRTTVRRNIAGFSGARKMSDEIVVTNVKVSLC
jgi:DNA adenine methylase